MAGIRASRRRPHFPRAMEVDQEGPASSTGSVSHQRSTPHSRSFNVSNQRRIIRDTNRRHDRRPASGNRGRRFNDNRRDGSLSSRFGSLYSDRMGRQQISSGPYARGGHRQNDNTQNRSLGRRRVGSGNDRNTQVGRRDDQTRRQGRNDGQRAVPRPGQGNVGRGERRSSSGRQRQQRSNKGTSNQPRQRPSRLTQEDLDKDLNKYMMRDKETGKQMLDAELDSYMLGAQGHVISNK